MWDRYATLVTGRRSWLLLLVVVVGAMLVIGLMGGNGASGRGPDSLPGTAESARASAASTRFPGGDTTAVVLVATRHDGSELDAADVSAVEAAARRMDPGTAAPRPAIVAPDRRAALAQVPVPAGLTGFALSDRVKELRAAANRDAPPPLVFQVTGGPAFGADIAKSFSGANVMLLAVTALVVMVLLIATYRSPVLWLLPLSVVALADRVATGVGTGLAHLTGLVFDGSTSGITSVLVFGAGTNYALLMVSRYRDELHRNDSHRDALRAAVRRAAPAILASNATVVTALLTLLLATLPNTRSLGAFAAAGLLVALVLVLFALPSALALCGRKVFWPFVPRVDDRDMARTGLWHGIAERVVRHPVRVVVPVLAVLVLCASGLLVTKVGLSQTQQFRVHAESVDGLHQVAAHFPSGASDPAIVVARTATTDAVQNVLDHTPGVSRATVAGVSATGLTRWSVVLDAEPASERAFTTVERMRTGLRMVPASDALVGGSDAQALDTRDAARRDQAVVIPLILVVILLVLLILLRAIPAALILVAVTVIGALAALGLGSMVSAHLFGFPALDTNVPLFGFLFLVALGVDYTIFLVVRAREETGRHGTIGGMVRAVASTGAVITSAGIVLAAVFCVLGVLPLITLTQLGIVVGIGILLDTFVVRTVAVPALFAILGDRIWWPGTPAGQRRPVEASERPKAGEKR